VSACAEFDRSSVSRSGGTVRVSSGSLYLVHERTKRVRFYPTDPQFAFFDALGGQTTLADPTSLIGLRSPIAKLGSRH